MGDAAVENRRGYVGSDSDDDPKAIFYTDRRYQSSAGPALTTGDYLSVIYEQSHANPDQRRLAFTFFILPKGRDADGITVGQGECVDVLVLPQPKPGGRRWRRSVSTD